MTLTHWVVRQNKLETPKEKDEVNKREVHEYDGCIVPPTPKPTHGSRQDFKKNYPTIYLLL
jgi:hypothetical protein